MEGLFESRALASILSKAKQKGDLTENVRVDSLSHCPRCQERSSRQLQAVLATIEQRHHQPNPDFGRSGHNPRCLMECALNMDIPIG